MAPESPYPEFELQQESKDSGAFIAVPALAAMVEMSPDRVVEVLTLLLGSEGIRRLLKGSKKYEEGDHVSGSTNIGIGNGILFSTALTGELIRHGHPANYTFAEIPFLIVALKDLSKNVQLFSRLKNVLEKVGAREILLLNMLIHGSMAALGSIASIEQALTSLGFMANSTAFGMDVESGSTEEQKNKQGLRRIVVICGTTTLALGSLMQTTPSLEPFLRTMDIKNLAVIPLIWFVLNVSFLYGEVKILLRQSGIREQIAVLGNTATDVLVKVSSPVDVNEGSTQTYPAVNAFEAFMH